MIDRHEPITIYGDGKSRWDYTHVNDIVTGVLGALDYVRDKKTFEIVNLGGGNPMTLAARRVTQRPLDNFQWPLLMGAGDGLLSRVLSDGVPSAL